MATTPEKKVKDAVTRLLKIYDAYYFYPVTGGFGRSGIPDIICCHRGHFIGIECKAGKNTTTALQDKELGLIEEAGGYAIVVNEETIHLVEDVLLKTMIGTKK